jgi:hypothetical protein
MLLRDGLEEIRAWMTTNPREVVTFIVEAYLDEQQTFGALVASGLADGWLGDAVQQPYVLV